MLVTVPNSLPEVEGYEKLGDPSISENWKSFPVSLGDLARLHLDLERRALWSEAARVREKMHLLVQTSVQHEDKSVVEKTLQHVVRGVVEAECTVTDKGYCIYGLLFETLSEATQTVTEILGRPMTKDLRRFWGLTPNNERGL